MAAVTQALPLQMRREHQRYVATLLDDLEERRRRLQVLQAYGVRPAGLRELKAELGTIRDRLAAAVEREAA
jgi:hypothetical protein